ncbi:MAG: hypothetical protein HZA46_06805 [Planctomycetales bacterium]|nr:hypothetical protein [Planctomycetales bacterium]
MRKGLRIALMALAVNCIGFFRGCEGNGIQMSMGFPLPFVVLDYAEVELPSAKYAPSVLMPKEVRDWSILTPPINVAILVLPVVWLWRNKLLRRQLWVAFWLTCSVSNCFIVAYGAWVQLVWSPTAWLGDIVAELVLWGIPEVESSEPGDLLVLTNLVYDVSSRLYFGLLLAFVYVLIALGERIYRRFCPSSTAQREADAAPAN